MKCLYLFKRKSKSKGEVESVPELRDNGDDSTLTRTTKSLPSPRSIHELYKENEHNLRVFSFQELSDATNGFSRRLKLGEGGFGSVYKGTLSPALPQGNPQIVAIKKLNNQGLQVVLLYLLPQYSKFYHNQIQGLSSILLHYIICLYSQQLTAAEY